MARSSPDRAARWGILQPWPQPVPSRPQRFVRLAGASVALSDIQKPPVCTPLRPKLNSSVMAESLVFSGDAGRRALYKEIAPQIEALVSGETDVTANLANIAAVLKQVFGYFWVGFYIVKDRQLVLGPFQGPLACTRINFDQGV